MAQITFKDDERLLLQTIIANQVKNMNSANQVPLKLPPDDYKTLCGIFNKINRI